MRKGLVISYLTIIAFLCIYLPWKIEADGRTESMGYSFIWAPPDYLSVDFGRLLLEIVAVTLLAVALSIMMGGKEVKLSEAKEDAEENKTKFDDYPSYPCPSDIKTTTPQVMDLIKMNVLYVIFMSLITLGIYFPIWILKRQKPLDNLQSNEKIGVAVPVTVILLLSFAVLFYLKAGFVKIDDISASNSFETLAAVSDAIGGFTLLFLCFKCRRILDEHFNDYLQKSIRFSMVATFFFGVYYLQYKINRIDV